jgi:hypothetical protein
LRIYRKAAKGAKWRKVAQREIVYRENPALLVTTQVRYFEDASKG